MSFLKKTGVRGQPIPPAIREEVYERAFELCEARLPCCTNAGTDLHHKKARSQGGSNDPKNLILLCRSCHVAITDCRPGTEKFRTLSYEPEG